MKRVGIDLDGTVANYMEGVIPLLKKAYGLEPNYDIQAYKIEEVFGLTSETRPPDMRKRLYEDLHLFRNLPKLEPDSHRLTHQMKDLGIKVYFITARTASNVIVKDTLHWLEKHDFIFDDLFFTHRKADLCNLMNIDVMIEDEIGQLIELLTQGVHTVIPRMPWNRRFDDVIEGRAVSAHWAHVQNCKEAFNQVKEFLS